MRFRIVLAALLGFSASLAQAEWALYSSKNFRLYSDGSETEVLALLNDFEEYRRVALMVMNLSDEAEDQALKIVHLTRTPDFRALGAPDNIVGFFYHEEFGPRIVMRGALSRRGNSTQAADRADRTTLYHEYVHYLMDQRSGLNHPPWYSEGLAQVLMMVDPTEQVIRVGMPFSGVNWRSVRATVEDIVDTDYDGSVDDFYLMSWLLTHYLTVDAFDKPERRRSTADYLRRYDAGEDPLEAFAASFGVSAAVLQSEIETYGRQRTLNVLRVPRAKYEGDITRRALQEGEELYLLGDLAVELYASDAALEFFDRFDKQYEDSPIRFKIRSRRAVALAHKDDLDTGDDLIDGLVALNLDDGDVFADIAHYFHDRFQIQADQADVDARANLEQSIRYGTLAVERNARDLEALFYLGRAYGFDGDFAMAIETLRRAFEQAPGARGISEALARVLYQSGNREDAILLISRSYSSSHSEEARKRYGELLQQMKDGNVDPEFLGPYSTAD